MATTLTYNGVTFHGCKTLEFSQTPVFDSLAGTDIVRHNVTVSVQGIVHEHGGASTPQWVDAGGGASGSAIFLRLQEKLLCPRKRLIFDVAGQEWLNVAPPATRGGSQGSNVQVDVDNGPRPLDLRIVHIARDVLKAQFSISASVILCCGGKATLPDVISNKWSASETLDENFFSTVTVDGRILVSSIRFNPQSFRGLVLPRLQRGYKITAMDFTTAPNGMEMQYRFVQRAIHAAPPPPATDWDCRHTVSQVRGGVAESQFHISLTGPPNVDRRQLIGAGVAAAEWRVGDITSANRGRGQNKIENITVTDYLSEPRIDLDVHIQHSRGHDAQAATATDLSAVFGKHLGTHDPHTSPYPQKILRDSLAGAFSMYLQDPCEGPNPIADTPSSGGPSNTYSPPSNPITGQPFGGGYYTPTVTTGNLTPYKSETSQDMRTSMYTFYRLETTYERSGFRIALPVAVQVDANGDPVEKDADTVKIVTLGPGLTTRVVKIHAERAGQWPQLPAPKDFGVAGNANQASGASGESHLLSSSYTTQSPELSADGQQYIYEADCVLVFAMSRPYKLGDRLAAGSSPVDTSKPADNRLPLDDKNSGKILE